MKLRPTKRARERKKALVTFDDVRQLALALPGVVEGACYGTPAFRIRGKLLARLREDGETIALLEVEDEERDALIAADPIAFNITDHYVGYRVVLIRFVKAPLEQVAALFERSWRRRAPKRLVAAYDAGTLLPPNPQPPNPQPPIPDP